jgi:tetratricopeptide (TPR) repeat protein
MSTAVLTNRLELDSVADGALNAATKFWFVVAVAGQLIFAFAVASFYGLTALRGDLFRWSRFITGGYRPGDSLGNLAIVMHVLSAVVIMSLGAVQLIPGVRKLFPVFHRWNGRLYMLAAVGVGAAGIYMTWFRGSIGDLPQHIGGSLNAVVIWICAAMALKYALARDFRTHRRWALRLFLVASAAWFYRLTFFLTLLIFKGPVGFDPITFTGPFPTIMSFAQYLFPLGVLELYFRAQEKPGVLRRMAMAGGLFVLTLAMGAGIFAVTMGVWTGQVRAGFDSRKSISETLKATIASSGIDQAEKQYLDLKAANNPTYNFDERELNSLGYQLLRKKQFSDAIRIFQMNVQAYPKSPNTYDSLGEAYLDAGDKSQAIASYRKVLALNPNARGAVLALEKLGAPVAAGN